MILPKIWGEGELFAPSALDFSGPAEEGVRYGDDFAGYLTGGCVGVRFFTEPRRTLLFPAAQPDGVRFEAVTSDYIEYYFPGNDRPFRLLFAGPHLLVGDCSEENLPEQTGGEDALTALLLDGTRFAYAWDAASSEKALRLAGEGMSADLDALAASRRAFYAENCPSDTAPYAELRAKCLSVMRTQLYCPEGSFTRRWSTPDRLPHRHLWLWDSVFHAVGFRRFDPGLAGELLLSAFARQTPSGFIPHLQKPGSGSAITQPPLLAWGAWELYESGAGTELLREVYEKNARFLGWLREHRRGRFAKENGLLLFSWHASRAEHCRCDESGMDNSPRFDTANPLAAVDLCCFYANECAHMEKIARVLGLEPDAGRWAAEFARARADIDRFLWSESDGFYFDYDLRRKTPRKVWSVASFLPLFAGLSDGAQTEALVAHLTDPALFWTPLPVPSVARTDATFGSDMWRGPVWINYDYLILRGLRRAGREDLAASLRSRLLDETDRLYRETGCLFEFYDSECERAPMELNRKGPARFPYDPDVKMQTIRDYGWTTTLVFELIGEKGFPPQN